MEEQILKSWGVFASVTVEDLLSDPKKYAMSNTRLNLLKTDGFWYNKAGKKRRNYLKSSGKYFTLNPGDDNLNSGSNFQYIYSTSPNISSYLQHGKHPNAISLIGASRYLKKHNLESESISGNGFDQKIELDILNYITSRTSGERVSPSKDGRKTASEYTEKISLRRSKLDRMILSLGIFDFSDIEMPKF